MALRGLALLIALAGVCALANCAPAQQGKKINCIHTMTFADDAARLAFVSANTGAIVEAAETGRMYLVPENAAPVVHALAPQATCDFAPLRGLVELDAATPVATTAMTDDLGDRLLGGSYNGDIVDDEVRQCIVRIPRLDAMTAPFVRTIIFVGLRRVTVFASQNTEGGDKATVVATDDPCAVTRPLVAETYRAALDAAIESELRVCAQQSLRACKAALGP